MYNLKPSLRKKASKLYFDESQRTYDELHSMFYSQWRIINSVQMFNINLIYWMFWKYLKNIISLNEWHIRGYPIPQLANTEIPCRKSTKYRYHIYDRWRLLNVVSISRVFFFLISQARIHQKSTSTFARKREKISNWSVQRWKSQVIKCPSNFIIE